MSEQRRFLFAVFIPAVVGFFICWGSVSYFRNYGLVLFVGLPILIGVLSTVIYNEDKSFGKAFAVSLGSLFFLSAALVSLAIEGLICLIMAFPLALLLNLIGVSITFAILQNIKNSNIHKISALILVCLMPLLLSFENSRKTVPTLHKVTTTVEINASIEKVWQNVIVFPQIEKAPEGILKLGFAYPINAKIEGNGVGAIRYCNFNTGAFVEPITTWQKPNLLAFDVKEQPRPMIEMSPYSHLEAIHLQYIKSEKGQFYLYEKDGKTIVEGTTFYTHDIAPDFYWQIWSDAIIHQIHLRVLNHIKEVSEK